MCAVMLDTKVCTLWSRFGHAVDTLRGHGLMLDEADVLAWHCSPAVQRRRRTCLQQKLVVGLMNSGSASERLCSLHRVSISLSPAGPRDPYRLPGERTPVHTQTTFFALYHKLCTSPLFFSRRAQRSAPASWRTNTGAMHTQTTFFALLSQPVYAVLLLQGPEIRTGFLENEQPVLLEAGHELTVTTDYSIKVGRCCFSWDVLWFGFLLSTAVAAAAAAMARRTSCHTSCRPPLPSGTDLTSPPTPLLLCSVPQGN